MGFLGSLGESLRAHVDERVRSPFAGAFVVAWVAINWQAILILAFSSKPIEDRIDFVSKNYLSMQDTVWYPLGLAAVIAVGFYFSSAFFSILAELYASVESLIAKFFDRIKWVSPEAYIQRKKDLQSKISELQGLASDNLQLVEDEKKKTRDVSENILVIQGKLNDAISEIGIKNSLVLELRGEISDISARVSTAENAAKASKIFLAKSAERVNKAYLQIQSILEKSRAGPGGDFIYTDKELLIILANNLKEMHAAIIADLNVIDSRENNA
jgi:hypothetical protein